MTDAITKASELLQAHQFVSAMTVAAADAKLNPRFYAIESAAQAAAILLGVELDEGREIVEQLIALRVEKPSMQYFDVAKPST